jgi:hypothetical protein
LIRHLKPGARVCIIAPRANIQDKWKKEISFFNEHFFRYRDLRNLGPDGRPVRRLAACHSLLDLCHRSLSDHDQDFLLRMTSFSLPLASGSDASITVKIRDALPWVKKAWLDARSKDACKNNIAAILCSVIPAFDLVIVDEAHNLRHGLGPDASDRNRIIAQVFGNRLGCTPPATDIPGFGPRAGKILLLSATPIETSYADLFHQLDIFGRGGPFEDLCRMDLKESEARDLVHTFLIRRVKAARIAGSTYSKNMYRREWRNGGMHIHDQPLRTTDPRSRLVVALMQKKVSEILTQRAQSSEDANRCGPSFQIGMLASFESYLKTALRPATTGTDQEQASFDGADQTADAAERQGIDVDAINRIADSHRRRFNGRELPHPKMDAVVDALGSAWHTGRKSLVFVRRVASVEELRRKLNDSYDRWLIDKLTTSLPDQVRPAFERIIARYHADRLADRSSHPSADRPNDATGSAADHEDEGGNDTFFSWFFRGKGPAQVFSGAALSRRCSKGRFATVFRDHPACHLLRTSPDRVLDAVASATGLDHPGVVQQIAERGAPYLRRIRKPTVDQRFDAAQDGLLGLLAAHATDPDLRTMAHTYLSSRQSIPLLADPRQVADPGLAHTLSRPTITTRLADADHLALGGILLPDMADAPLGQRFWLRRLRIAMLSAAARLGHASIDLFLAAMMDRRSLDARAQAEEHDSERQSPSIDDQAQESTILLDRFLDRMEEQRRGDGGSEWAGWAELRTLSEHFDLIIDQFDPELRTRRDQDPTLRLSILFGRQQPVGGMHGTVNKTLVAQFRTPGYPLVLISTDLLQEGEDLHTFCDHVVHYGISWTSAAMEQRIGRLDRVLSLTERRFQRLERAPTADELLQVHYPHLQDTIEVLQVGRVLRRMDGFLRLMHHGLAAATEESQSLDVDQAMLGPVRIPAQPRELLTSAFAILPQHLTGERRPLPVSRAAVNAWIERFRRLCSAITVPITWETTDDPCRRLGTMRTASDRIQPFRLSLMAWNGHMMVRCESPIGRALSDPDAHSVDAAAMVLNSRVVAVPKDRIGSYDLAIVDDVLLTDDPSFDAERAGTLITRVAEDGDTCEQQYWRDGRDQLMHQFAADLAKNDHHGR